MKVISNEADMICRVLNLNNTSPPSLSLLMNAVTCTWGLDQLGGDGAVGAVSPNMSPGMTRDNGELHPVTSYRCEVMMGHNVGSYPSPSEQNTKKHNHNNSLEPGCLDLPESVFVWEFKESQTMVTVLLLVEEMLIVALFSWSGCNYCNLWWIIRTDQQQSLLTTLLLLYCSI